MQETSVYSILGKWDKGVISAIPSEDFLYSTTNIFLDNGEISTGWGKSKSVIIDYKGRFQGAYIHKFGGKQFLLIGLGGKVYISELPHLLEWGELCVLSSKAPMLYFATIGECLVIQDGVNKPVVVYGEEVYSNHNVPRGTIMGVAYNRLFVKLTSNAFVASDIYLPYKPTNFSKFKESVYLAGGGALGLPEALGSIVGMETLQSVDTGIGEGNLIVFAEKGICGFNVAVPRVKWSDVELSKVLVKNVKPKGARALKAVNTDIYFIDGIGLSTIGYARTNVQKLVVGSTLSELAPSLFPRQTEWANKYSSLAFMDNRVLSTVSASGRYITDNDGFPRPEIYFNGIVSLNCNMPTSTNNIPVFETLITNYQPLQILDGGWIIQRITSNNVSKLEICQLKRTEPYNKASIVISNITMTKFSESNYVDYVNKRKLWSIYVDVSEVVGIVELTAYVKPTGSHYWQALDTRILSNKRALNSNTYGAYCERVSFNAKTGIKTSKTFDLKLEVKGVCKIKSITTYGRTVASEIDNSTYTSNLGLTNKNDDIYVYLN